MLRISIFLISLTMLSSHAYAGLFFSMDSSNSFGMGYNFVGKKWDQGASAGYEIQIGGDLYTVGNGLNIGEADVGITRLSYLMPSDSGAHIGATVIITSLDESVGSFSSVTSAGARGFGLFYGKMPSRASGSGIMWRVGFDFVSSLNTTVGGTAFDSVDLSGLSLSIGYQLF